MQPCGVDTFENTETRWSTPIQLNAFSPFQPPRDYDLVPALLSSHSRFLPGWPASCVYHRANPMRFSLVLSICSPGFESESNFCLKLPYYLRGSSDNACTAAYYSAIVCFALSFDAWANLFTSLNCLCTRGRDASVQGILRFPLNFASDNFLLNCFWSKLIYSFDISCCKESWQIYELCVNYERTILQRVIPRATCY